jgi:Fur family transcriptional regulator, zinc uptake regulator
MKSLPEIPEIKVNEREVLDLLTRQQVPLSAYDILDHLRGTRLRAAVQVYRALEKLSGLGLVHRLESLNAYVACHCAHAETSPGFMLCTCCGGVREFDAGKSVSAVQNQVAGFKITSPSVELKGLCAHCQTKNHTHAKIFGLTL